MYDLKDWFLIPSIKAGLKLANGQVYGRETHHLEGVNDQNGSLVYAYHTDTGKTMVFGKTPHGFPWDLKSYDQKFIYDWATELDWTNPKDFKMQSAPVPMCPRFWDGNPTTYQFSQHMPYNEYRNCVKGTAGDVGPAYFTIQPSFPMDFGGDVGVTNTILLTYYWGDRKHREQLFLTLTAGWVRWSHAVLTQLPGSAYSDYVIDSSVIHNKIVLGQVAPQFPCQPIP
jgi:hypothetical protein